jgi:hypothetical protein
MQGNKVTEDREFPVSPDEEEPWELQVSYRKMHQPSNCLYLSSICISLDQLALASLYSTAIRCISCQSKPVSHKMQVPFLSFEKISKCKCRGKINAACYLPRKGWKLGLIFVQCVERPFTR